MFQLALLPDSPVIHYQPEGVTVNLWDVKTEADWHKLGFKVDHYEKVKPFIQTICGAKFYSFDQVDVIHKVDIAVYRARMAWYDQHET